MKVTHVGGSRKAAPPIKMQRPQGSARSLLPGFIGLLMLVGIGLSSPHASAADLFSKFHLTISLASLGRGKGLNSDKLAITDASDVVEEHLLLHLFLLEQRFHRIAYVQYAERPGAHVDNRDVLQVPRSHGLPHRVDIILRAARHEGPAHQRGYRRR